MGNIFDFYLRFRAPSGLPKVRAYGHSPVAPRNRHYRVCYMGNRSCFLAVSGVILIVGSQIVSATQMVIEETFLKKRSFHPLHVCTFRPNYVFFLSTFRFPGKTLIAAVL